LNEKEPQKSGSSGEKQEQENPEEYENMQTQTKCGSIQEIDGSMDMMGSQLSCSTISTDRGSN
jgi:hypothetical protein